MPIVNRRVVVAGVKSVRKKQKEGPFLTFFDSAYQLNLNVSLFHYLLSIHNRIYYGPQCIHTYIHRKREISTGGLAD